MELEFVGPYFGQWFSPRVSFICKWEWNSESMMSTCFISFVIYCRSWWSKVHNPHYSILILIFLTREQTRCLFANELIKNFNNLHGCNYYIALFIPICFFRWCRLVFYSNVYTINNFAVSHIHFSDTQTYVLFYYYLVF